MGKNDYQSPGALKTYVIGTDHVHTNRILEIQHDNVPILWAVSNHFSFHRPQTNITADPEGTNILAAVKTRSMRGVRVMLGDNPDALPDDAWADVKPEGMSSSQHGFVFDERPFWWRRTHDKQYGSSAFGGMDFKLVDGDNKVLAVYIKDSRTFHIEEIGRIDYFVELGRELELFSLAAILGIQASIKRSRRNGANNNTMHH